jgi:hypothetical protein
MGGLFEVYIMTEKVNTATSKVGGSGHLNIKRTERKEVIIYEIFDTSEGQNYTIVVDKNGFKAQQQEPRMRGITNRNDADRTPAQQYVFMHNEHIKLISQEKLDVRF